MDYTPGSAALEQLSDGALAILKVASLLDPDGVQQEIMTLDPEGASSIGFPQDLDSYLTTLGQLTYFSLITTKTDSNELILHRTVPQLIRNKIAAKPGQLEVTFDCAVRLVSAVWPFVTVDHQPGVATYTRIGRWKKCEKVSPHVLNLKLTFEDYTLALRKLSSTREFLLLLSELAW